ncbi:MAG: beta-N-acetylglucosaminidase domain-containing protein [Thiohalospira sp.]
MKYFNLTLILSLVIIFTIISGCKKKDEVIINQSAWSSKDPISIPYIQRKKQGQIVNLVFNPSFETGKIYYEKSNIKSFDVNGWKKIGENVEWVNIESNHFNKDEAFDGTHAIKINRTRADETEELGVGIISDYIKVIPGNYSLSMYLKLENICPIKARLGTKLYDAVNIRLQFFDKNKIKIKSSEYDPFRNRKIDNAFKSLNLSNYWNISEFGWGKVVGQSAKFPFFDGDIPDETRYVKIFIGLKGVGKMWIDNVNFTYTNDNFTFLERMRPYFDSSFTYYDLLMPEPKYLKKLAPVSLFTDKLYPVIIIPENCDTKTLLAAQKIRNFLVEIFHKSLNNFSADNIKIVSDNKFSIKQNKRFIISLGKTAYYKKNKNLLPDTSVRYKKQGYFITQTDNAPNIVFICGSDADGNYNAALTFNQLIDKNNLLFHSAEIIDFPDFEQRSFLINRFKGNVQELKLALNELADFKLNHAYFEAYENNRQFYPFDDFTPSLFVGNTSILIDLLKYNWLNDFEDDYNGMNDIMVQKTNLLADKISALDNSFLSNVLIKGDYLKPYEPCNPDLIKFITSENISVNLQKYHKQLITILNNKVKANLEFMTPWSQLDNINMGMGQAEFYYRDLMRNLDLDIPVYWTGGSFYSPTIDYAEWFRMQKLAQKKPVLFDNSLNHNIQRFKNEEVKKFYAGKLRVLSIFEPLKAQYPDNFYRLNYGKKIILNIDSLTKINSLKAITAANYYWNTDDYDRDKSIWKVLVKFYGIENAKKLVYFNDSYFGLKEMCQKIDNNGINNKNTRIAEKFYNDLIYYFEKLENDLGDKELMSELLVLKNMLVNQYQFIISEQ